MSRHYLLLDPGVLLPPPAGEVQAYQDFWVRVVAWAADRRVVLGEWGRSVVLDAFGDGWPDLSPPSCPKPLVRDATQAVRTLLTRVAPSVASSTAEIRRFDPAYIRDDDIEESLKLDVAATHDQGLLGAATSLGHWAAVTDAVVVEPGPPSALNLVPTPGAEVAGERELRLARALDALDLTIIGGKKVSDLSDAIEQRFGCRIKWIEAEKGREPNLDPLKGLTAERDIVVCLTGAIGHSASGVVAKATTSRAITLIYAETPNNIVQALLTRFAS